MGAYECFRQTKFGGARSRDQNFTGRKWAKKLTNLNRYISVTTDIDEKRFVIFERTINHFSFGYVRLPQLEYYFSCFGIFFLTFSFSSDITYF